VAVDAGLSGQQEQEFFELLQRKAMTEIRTWVASNITQPDKAVHFLSLPDLAGGLDVLAKSRQVYASLPKAIAALDQLDEVASVVCQRYPEAELYFDLGEVRGYHYLTGLVFAAFAPGYGNPIASGGRYDHIGEVFGRARPATGFAVDITALSKLGLLVKSTLTAIAVIENQDPRQWQAIQQLRAQGERVVSLTSAGLIAELGFDRQLVLQGGEYQIVAL
jgi:ATP phosphoribosyltransferase regulatory subunit